MDTHTNGMRRRVFLQRAGALGLLAGVSPGSLAIDGKQTPFVIPNFNPKGFFYRDKDDKTRLEVVRWKLPDKK